MGGQGGHLSQVGTEPPASCPPANSLQSSVAVPGRIRMFLGLLDPDPLVRGMDPDPDPSVIMQK